MPQDLLLGSYWVILVFFHLYFLTGNVNVFLALKKSIDPDLVFGGCSVKKRQVKSPKAKLLLIQPGLEV